MHPLGEPFPKVEVCPFDEPFPKVEMCPLALSQGGGASIR